MDRRDTIKSLFLGSVAAGLALNGCSTEGASESEKVQIANSNLYGRTGSEKLRDQKLFETKFFTEHELTTVAVLCDIILPKNKDFGAATDSGVPEFIDFIVKDMPYQQTPIRGGIMWLDGFSNKLYGRTFVNCTNKEQLAICDQLAYPKKTKPELKQGERFFTRIRNLTMTGYFTSKMGIEDLGYKGNSPTVWDGVPDEVLQKHGLSYEKEWLAKCINQANRGEIAEWDKKGNLIN